MVTKTLWWVGSAVACIALVGWLWTPDQSRTLLEKKYAHGPSEFLDVAGIRLHVRVSGPTTAPAIIFIHGFGASLQTWEPWASLLPDYRVIRFDLPGFALTGPDPTGDYTDVRSIKVLLALLDALHVKHATVVGHSIGGRIAWMFAATHPERMDKLVLIAPDGFASPGFEYGKQPKIPPLLQLMRYALPKSLLKMNLVAGYANPAAMTDEVVTRYHDLMLVPGVRDAMLKRLQQTVLVDPHPFLQRIHAPVLLLWGEQDAMIPVSNSTDYSKVLPDSTFVSLPGLGHLLHEEAPAISIKPLKTFLAR